MPYLFTGRAPELPDSPRCAWFVRWPGVGVWHVPTRHAGLLALAALGQR